MKKYLLILFSCFVTAISFAASKIDTLYFKAGDAGNALLQVDTVKYPYLKGHEADVTWMVGFEEVTATFNPIDESPAVKETVCSMKIPSEAIVTLDGKKYLHNENIGDTWYPGVTDMRTITVFYTHQIVGTKSITDIYGTWFTKDELKGYICDTVAVLHISKELKNNYFDFNFSGKGNTYRVGDTVKVSTSIKKNQIEPLDIQQFALANIEGKDTTILAISDSSKIEYVTDTEMDAANVQVIAYNNINYVASKTKKKLTVLPAFEIESLVYSVANDTTIYSKTAEYTNEINVEVQNHDSLALVINSNNKTSKYNLHYSWNKDGKDLPSDVIYIGDDKDNTKCNIIAFSEFVKPDFDGVYNCIISDNDSKKVLATVSFNVTSSYPTANEDIEINKISFSIVGDNLKINTVESGELMICNTLGQIVKLQYVNGNANVILPNQSGVYICKFNNKTFKFVK